MSTSSTPRFHCPHCRAPYIQMRVESDSAPDEGAVACAVCGEPLPARDGQSILKYFLLRPNSSAQNAHYSLV